MKIRSVTCFYNPSSPNAVQELDNLAHLAKAARLRLKKAGIEVQTCRLATVPFPYFLDLNDKTAAIKKVQDLEYTAIQKKFDYVSIGPALVEYPESYEIIPALISSTENIFMGGIIVNRSREISLAAIQACGRIISEISKIQPDGFGNLRFASLANVPPYAPFFPAAYSSGRECSFALAMECADIAINSFKNASSLLDARQNLITQLEQQANDLTAITNQLASEFGVNFKGLDFSLAPFPDDQISLGGAMERLGIRQLGLNGSIAAAAFVADSLDRGNWLRTGFNGLMLPVLEDSILSRRSIEGTLTIKDLLVYSAVCGTGLDTIPLPGDTPPENIAPLLLDLAALAARLDKPLTARLMPIPGKKAGEMTNFSFNFFANGIIMDLHSEPLHGLFASQEKFILNPRQK